MVQVYWQLKQRVWENMQVLQCRKDVGHLHQFDWEVLLAMPTTSGHRVVSTSAGRLHGCPHIWFAGQPALLQLIQQTLFRQHDPISGDVVRLLYTLLCTPPRERRNV